MEIEIGDILKYKDGSLKEIFEIDKKLSVPYYLIVADGQKCWERQNWLLDDILSIIKKDKYIEQPYFIEKGE